MILKERLVAYIARISPPKSTNDLFSRLQRFLGEGKILFLKLARNLIKLEEVQKTLMLLSEKEEAMITNFFRSNKLEEAFLCHTKKLFLQKALLKLHEVLPNLHARLSIFLKAGAHLVSRAEILAECFKKNVFSFPDETCTERKGEIAMQLLLADLNDDQPPWNLDIAAFALEIKTLSEEVKSFDIFRFFSEISFEEVEGDFIPSQ